jgi:teichuronic acid biosynthesis glycosyltransferase TuaC
MKILHITNNYPTKKFPIFGIFVKEQIESLNAEGISTEVFFMNTREKGKKEYFYSLPKLFIKLLTNKFDVVHCHHAFSGFIFFIMGISIFNKKFLSYQGTPDIEGGQRLFKINTWFFNSIIHKANFTKYSNNKVFYLPNGVNIDFFVPMDRVECKRKLDLDINKIYILFMDSYVGRPYKRVDRFKKTIEILRKKFEYSNIEEMVLTNTDRKLIPFYINASSLHLLTSDVEGSPNSVKECLACNVPVVSTPVGNVDELISDVQGSYMSKSFDSEELAKLVHKSLTSQTHNGREKLIEKQLDIKNVALKLKSEYEKILKND